MTFRISVIGCGYMARTGHGPAYRKYMLAHPDTELAACCDVDEQRARGFRELFGFQHHYTDWQVMLEQERPDVVCLLVPPHITAALGVQIMERGYPLLLEKPPGLDGAQCRQLLQVAQQRNIPNQVAFNRRFVPLVGELQQAIAKLPPQLPLQNISYDFYRLNRTDDDFATTAIHGIDTVRFLAQSDIRSARFSYQELPHFGPTVVNAFMDCTMESGCTAQLRFCPCSGITLERATLHFAGHSFFLDMPVGGPAGMNGRLIHVAKNKVVADIEAAKMPGTTEYFEQFGFYTENAVFFDAVRGGRMPENDIASGLQSVELADCIRTRKAEYTNR